ncbi:MAG: NAD-dependent epimerase/dehydratase family protein [Rhodospirillales bacterium]
MTRARPDFTVLGAAGFVGGHMVRWLEAQGRSVHAPARHDALVFDRPLGHVVYAIGLTADYAARPFDTVEAHTTLFARLLREAAFDSVVYLSSTRLYDWTGRDGDAEADLVLNPHNPRHLYDFTKGVGESLCNVCGGGRARVARLSCVYADDLAADNFLHRMIAGALEEPRLTVESDPAAARDYIHADDVCAALAAIAERGRRLVYNVAAGANVANRDLFAMIEAATGCCIAATGHGAPARAPLIDVAPLLADFGLAPRALADALLAIVAARRGAPRRKAG